MDRSHAVEVRSSTHLFLDLPRIEPALRAFIATSSAAGAWSDNSRALTESWLASGLKPRCSEWGCARPRNTAPGVGRTAAARPSSLLAAVTRDLKWGTPVPHERFSDKGAPPLALLLEGHTHTPPPTAPPPPSLLRVV